MLDRVQAPQASIIAALQLLPPAMDSRAARVMLYAAGYQESSFHAVTQYAGGPARGWWEFEEGGATAGIFANDRLRPLAVAVCYARGVKPSVAGVQLCLAHDEVLAAAMARLLLASDPQALPAPIAEARALAWACYLRNWRPGRPRPERWGGSWDAALEAM